MTAKKKDESKFEKDFDLSEFPFLMQEILHDWLEYKEYKYKPVGWKSLVKQIYRAMETHGTDIVVDRIEEAIANNWMGMNLKSIGQNYFNINQ